MMTITIHCLTIQHLPKFYKMQNKQNDDDERNDDSKGRSNNASQDETTSVMMTESNIVMAQILQEMHCLSGWSNPITNKVIERAEANKVTKGTIMAGSDESSENSNAATHQSGREVAHAMIELSPSQFAFYVKTGVIDTNLNFNNAY